MLRNAFEYLAERLFKKGLVYVNIIKPKRYLMETARNNLCPILVAVLILISVDALSQECVVAQNGVPRAVILCSTQLAETLAATISDFQNHLFRMCRATIESIDEPKPGSNVIHLITEKEMLPFPDRVVVEGLNEEGFIIRVEEGKAWLYGRSDLAIQHSLYWILEQWGCRWLFPGAAGEVVPYSPTLTITKSMETEQQPRFLMRDIWYNWEGALPEEVREDHRLWMKRNRLDSSLRGTIGHAYHRIVSHQDEELFAEHPEYFPEKNGRRVRTGQICTGNQGVRERAAQHALDFFKAHPEAKMVSMSPNDGGGPWRCPESEQFRCFTDSALSLANHVADFLKTRPETQDKMVAMYAYFITSWPPSFEASDNVIIFQATRFNLIPWPWLAQKWRKKTNHLAIRDYASVLPWHWTKPVWRLENLQRKFRIWESLDVEGISVESGNDWGGWGLYHYAMAKLMWNPGEKVQYIFKDFVSSGFREVAGPMERYFSRWRWGYSRQTLSLGIRDLAEAFREAPTEEIRWRVGHYVLYLHHLQLMHEYLRSQSREMKKEALKTLISFGWRLVPTNMAHTVPLIDRYLRKHAQRHLRIGEELDSWKQTEPFNLDEIEEILEKDLEKAEAFLSGSNPEPLLSAVEPFLLFWW